MRPSCALLAGLCLLVSLSFLTARGDVEGCRIAILDLSDSQFGLPKCDIDERVMSEGGMVVSKGPDRQGGESHKYSQASGPYWLYESIKASPYYTADPEAATVVYAYDYCLQFWHIAAGYGGGYKDGIDVGLLLQSAYDQMRRTERWRWNDGLDFVFYASHPLGGASFTYDMACKDLGRSNHLVVEAAQRLICKEEEGRRSFLVVPYSSPAFADRDQDVPPLSKDRDISIFFRAQCTDVAEMGSEKPVYGLRMRRHIVEAVRAAQDPHASVECTADVGRMPYDELLASLQSSRFCLLPPGETASSRRLTDVVLSGCIPVFIGPPWHEMPLAEYVKYAEFAVFVTAPQPRYLYGGHEIGDYTSLEDSPYERASGVYDPVFWFPALNVSEVAMTLENLEQLPEKLRGLPEEEVQRKQARLAEAQPLFRYRRQPHELTQPGLITGSDAIMEEMCKAGAVVQSAARTLARSAPESAAPSPIDEPAASTAPLRVHLIERPRHIVRKAGQYMHEAMRKTFGRPE